MTLGSGLDPDYTEAVWNAGHWISDQWPGFKIHHIHSYPSDRRSTARALSDEGVSLDQIDAVRRVSNGQNPLLPP
jgi:hypothetical protein